MAMGSYKLMKLTRDFMHPGNEKGMFNLAFIYTQNNDLYNYHVEVGTHTFSIAVK